MKYIVNSDDEIPPSYREFKQDYYSTALMIVTAGLAVISFLTVLNYL